LDASGVIRIYCNVHGIVNANLGFEAEIIETDVIPTLSIDRF